MLELTSGQRALLADSLKDIGNIAAGIMLFGQALGEEPFSGSAFFGGLVLWFALTGFAVRLMRLNQP